MTAYLVDTNLPSELTKPSPDPRVAEFLIRTGRQNTYVSVVTIGEICRGIAGLPESRRQEDLQTWLDLVMRPWFQGRILPITETVAERWGRLTSDQRRRGRQITMADGLIAATALEHQLTLLTRNVKDFEGLGVTVINPWEST